MTTLPPPESFDDHTLTEYVETLLLVEEDRHLSLAELVSRFPSGQRPSSSDVGLIRSEVNRRAFLLPRHYPYRADDAGVYRLANAGLGVYDFLLLLSLEHAPYRREDRYNQANRIFDFLVREGMKAWLRPTGEAVRFGTPVQDGRPSLFEDAIAWLASRMGLATLVDDVPVDDNDAGVDVVAWQPFSSGRSGFPVFLIQCTVQLSYESKALQIPVALWKSMIDIGPSPQTALAVPFTVRDGDDRWMKVSLAAHLLERLRICEMLEPVDLSAFGELAELEEFVENELASLRNVLSDPEGGLLESVGERRSKSPRIAKPRRQRASERRNPLRR